MLDILIIGGGPAGLSAAIYGKRANLTLAVAEKDYQGTGQIAESSCVDNYPGMPKISGYELGERFRQHAQQMQVDFWEEKAKSFQKTADGWKVCFESGKETNARTVIFCTGAAHRMLGAEREEKFLGRGISVCAVCDGIFYQNKTVAVIGGGDTALSDAEYLAKICKKVCLIHRREEFRGSAKQVECLKQMPNVEIITPAQVTEIIGEEKISGVRLADGRIVEADGIFYAVGMVPRTEILRDVLALNAEGYIPADETGKTSEEGFFAAGDVREKKLRQVITAVADGANAAMAAADYMKTAGKRGGRI